MRVATLLRWSVVALFGLAAAAFIAVRRFGILPPWAVAVPAGSGALAAAAAFACDVAEVPGSRRLATAARALLFGGVAFAGLAGLAGWMMSVQGFAMLGEGEPVRIASVDDLRKHWGGPLGSVRDLRGTIVLEKLVLRPELGGFRPVSRIMLRRENGDVQGIEVSSGASAAAGALRLHQGAFGFAPRIVVQRDGRTIFDGSVPFRTGVLGDRAVSFEGEVDVPAEGLHIAGEVDISSLDEKMRGHAVLRLRVEKAGEEIGKGELRPGNFAELRGGYRIACAGMKRWSEIDVKRSGVAAWVRAGLAGAAAGLLLWPIAAWRRW